MNYTDSKAFETMRERLLQEAAKMDGLAASNQGMDGGHYAKQTERYLALAGACDTLCNPPENLEAVKEATALLSDDQAAPFSSLNEDLREGFWTFQTKYRKRLAEAMHSTDERGSR